MKRNQKKCIILLSGGLDSSTVLYYAIKKGYKCFCLIFDYGQRHSKEISFSKNIAKRAGVPFVLIRMDLPWKGSSLLDKNISLPKGSATRRGIPSTYVPGRNTIFLSYATSYAESIGAETIFIGANAVDFSGYPDCRPSYFKKWNNLLRSLDLKIRIRVPLIKMKKSSIIRLGNSLGVPYQLTWSCYKGSSKPCGVCDSCVLRAKGFREVKTLDPAL